MLMNSRRPSHNKSSEETAVMATRTLTSLADLRNCGHKQQLTNDALCLNGVLDLAVARRVVWYTRLDATRRLAKPISVGVDSYECCSRGTLSIVKRIGSSVSTCTSSDLT